MSPAVPTTSTTSKRKRSGFITAVIASVWACSWFYVLLDSHGASRAFDNAVADLSGKYIFDRDLCEGYCDLGNPFVSYTAASNNTEVTVLHASTNALMISYVMNSGDIETKEIDLTCNRFGWHDGTLYFVDDEVTGVGASALPGFAKRMKSSAISKTWNGDLRIKSAVVEKGMVLLLFPFRDRHEYQMILKRKPSSERRTGSSPRSHQ